MPSISIEAFLELGMPYTVVNTSVSLNLRIYNALMLGLWYFMCGFSCIIL